MPIEQVNAVLAFLDGTRKLKQLKNRFRQAVEALTGKRLSRAQLRKVFKGNIHDHIDCFPEYYTMLSKWHELYDFQLDQVSYPEGLVGYWKSQNFDPSNVAFPTDVVELFRGDRLPKGLTGRTRAVELRKHRRQAAQIYGKFLVDYGSGSLFQYVAAIGVHILPIMQDAESIELILKQRLANAKKQGERVLELRGAPQLHTWHGLSMEEALLSYIAGVNDADIPVGLIVCALRHEDPMVAWTLAKLAIKYRENGVTTFDLAADEKGNPGVLRWWIKPALLALLGGLNLTIHLWETNEPTDDDIRCLDAFDVMLPLVRKIIARLGLNVGGAGTSSDVEASVSQVLNAVITAVLDNQPLVVNGETFEYEIVADAKQASKNALGIVVAAESVADRLGHGIRGRRQGKRFCEVCVSSNIVTGQVKDVASHPIHEMWKRGVPVVPCTDGTTLIGISGLLDELVKLQDHGWNAADFLVCGMLCVMALSVGVHAKTDLAYECVESFEALL